MVLFVEEKGGKLLIIARQAYFYKCSVINFFKQIKYKVFVSGPVRTVSLVLYVSLTHWLINLLTQVWAYELK